MIASLHTQIRNFRFAIPFILLFTLVLVALNIDLVSRDIILSNAIIIDLIIIIPFIWFLVIRKSKVPKITIVPLLIIGTTVGVNIIPEQNQYYLSLFRSYGIPLIELGVITFIIIKTRRVIIDLNQNQKNQSDFYEALLITCKESLPGPIASLLATEIGIIYFGFFKWKSKQLQKNNFTYHKTSGSIATLAIIILLVIAETFIFHILLEKWNIYAAWILSGLSIYSGLQIFGWLKSIYYRPHIILENKIILRFGIISEAIIPIENIEKIELSSKDLPEDKSCQKLSPLGALDYHNVIITLKEASTFKSFYGLRKEFKSLAIYVDKKEEFKGMINNQTA
ncbi:hypothetical protein [Marinigracilibium pacificum]|uniref:Uncharacterized protein n=1 Tax=Marinigracilibium pacificum TaxID=2729599 RepID=A0A848IVQ2_9BACT|nr:hypothetical protein [Marinigracilibium pacificum]NMM47321.1 hypothetical protein [Marinigracilibium pacificum]